VLFTGGASVPFLSGGDFMTLTAGQAAEAGERAAPGAQAFRMKTTAMPGGRSQGAALRAGAEITSSQPGPDFGNLAVLCRTRRGKARGPAGSASLPLSPGGARRAIS
jgi:hypothetical protein